MLNEKNINSKNLILYHGSNIEVINPKIIPGKFTKDFGYGFYCTIKEQQAIRWSLRTGKGVVSIYNYNYSKNLNIKIFNDMTEEWLDFIVNCRNGKEHKYDIVEGPMADDQIYNYITQFIQGIINREQFWIMIKFNYPTHQICFCTERSLDTLVYKGCDYYDE
ncbi:DUF3990 domain-containing protein [Clostridium butyricum]|uniref:DUF3990 domain-containing protein n=1 Tax=Clostridium butyricum TaxID=1492 RepID=A0AAP9UD17_CLOBU|nr:DUF3990 domain-containing protein [Clostridium butyricum]MBZ5745763.1 DUF3990 domain-containing protein [Clostridium butyricum]MCQ2016338.1 DUF3990 domain-containing protein [Clostridium butyricum]MCQ2020375.1 DUF3990 domain-containing protein [Clostridium butyricum]MDI9210709.1 DUF3990 domain-containing protein [Clostridium butyricum]NFB70507.1 DUF3990 domain-containing protein [Clostridium butyricum]